MKKLFFIALVLLQQSCLYAQKKTGNSPGNFLRPEQWEVEPGKVEFTGSGDQSVMKITNAGTVARLKNIEFANGIIEYDVQLQEPGFASIYFRMQDMLETECFYLRGGRAGNPVAMDAIQYAPFLKGVNLWDLLPQYQAAAELYPDRPNHIKLVISGKKMLAYVNSSQWPALQIPLLEGNTIKGAIAFDGKVIISHLTIKPNETEGLSPEAGMDITNNDPRYLRSWKVSAPFEFPVGQELYSKLLPDSTVQWQPIHAERAGLVNLTRLLGGGNYLKRQAVWLKVVLQVKKEQTKKMDFGFSDEVWVYLNGKTIYTDKNLYPEAMRKVPDGRISVENAQFELPLKTGDNELLIGVANNFYGWGIIARLGSMDGVVIK
ncbi:hypothetical protein A8C56_00390 [Niabella ginsenosidivorans]|uniref:3-keto-disaccharide hydrolase domain-containing protein n=1 Tax=Niabella ginsenosidivorans TaxID=1176587 RepID=A0A1A9HX22_9BACT|nr:hypothetical protein [Niabella ginsenosidivorans]ANH79635.1 hypothetical protein A8C56_00390 [Niabella ginsenosidivorans]